MHKTRGAALLAAAAMVASGLAACGDEGEPTESTSTASPSAVETDSPSGSESSGSESSSSSPGASGSGSDDKVAELPVEAKKRSKEGAIAFNEFYQEQMGEALKTGNADTLRKYSQGCEACDEYIRITEENTARGTKMDKNPNTIRKATASKRSDSGFKATITVHAKEYHEVLSDGSAGRKADAVTYTVATDTQWSGKHWIIRDSVIIK